MNLVPANNKHIVVLLSGGIDCSLGKRRMSLLFFPMNYGLASRSLCRKQVGRRDTSAA